MRTGNAASDTSLHSPHVAAPPALRAADARVVDLAVGGEDGVDEVVVGGVDAGGVPVHQLLDLVLVDELLERSRARRASHCAEYPPSTGSTTPVTNDAASEQSQSTASAISGAVPCARAGAWP